VLFGFHFNPKNEKKKFKHPGMLGINSSSIIGAQGRSKNKKNKKWRINKQNELLNENWE
jgi:hypothetical protein